MSSQYNAHAELITGPYNFYEGGICCSGINGLSTNCASGEPFLKLSSQTNAHVEQKDYLYYPNENKACISAADAVSCNYRDDCGADVCVVTMSAETNAHVADCNSSKNYSVKVCCNVAPSPEIIGANWTNMLGNKIDVANQSDTVMLTVIGINLGSSFNFTIYKDNTWPMGDDPVANIPNQNKIAIWKTPNEEGAKYYFKIKTEYYGELGGQSNELSVKGINNSPPVSVITFPNYKERINYNFSTGKTVYFEHASYDIDDDIRNATFEWSFGDGTTSGLLDFASSNTSHVYSRGGGKNIILKVTDLRGEIGSSNMKIYADTPLIDDPPVAIISSPKNGSILNSPTVFFNATLSTDDLTTFENLRFTWRFNDNDPSHANVNGTAGANFTKQFRFASTPANPHWAEVTVQD